MKTRLLLAAAGLTALAATVSAGPVKHAGTAAGTVSILHGQDRELMSLAFATTGFTLTGADFLNFTDGSIVNNIGPYGWFDPMARDVDGANVYTGNPDRADGSSPYDGEAAATGTLAEVFGAFSGYKNMSRLIDGEDNAGWVLDLLFDPSRRLDADGDDATVEVAVLERGRNSDFNIYGITTGNAVTGPLFVSRAETGGVGWSLDTLEIGGAQEVGAVGISLDASWVDLIGLRIEAASGFNGPDLIAVGTGPLRTVPAPGSFALAGLAALTVGAARRR